MKKLSILVLTSVICLPIAGYAAEGPGSVYSNVGATLISNDSHNEAAYYFEVGYNHKLDQLFSADVNYKRVATLDSSVDAGSDDFVQTYDTYGLGLRADQRFGNLSVFAKAGASFISSEITTWDAGTGAEQVDNDDSFKPYAGAGINLASPYDKRLTFGAGIDYQMLSNGEHATSFNGGVNYAF